MIDSGKALCWNGPAGTNPALYRAVGVFLKQAWLQTLLRRPAEMQRDPDVAVGLLAHGTARAGARDRAPGPPEPGDLAQPKQKGGRALARSPAG